MNPYSGAEQKFRLYSKTMIMLTEANMVIGMRVIGMNGIWRVTPGENRRMIHEKLAASSESGHAKSRAALTGGSPVAIAVAGLKPIRRRTLANVQRLAKRGPGPRT
jgi:hypothetical protein